MMFEKLCQRFAAVLAILVATALAISLVALTLQAGVLVKAPTAKRMREAFPDLTPAEIFLIRELAHIVDDPERLALTIAQHCPATDAYARRCHGSPFVSHMWRVTLVLHAIDEIVCTHGVEPLRRKEDGDMGPPSYEYCNAGDIYATTLIYHRDADALRIGAWGDIIEREMNAFE